MGRFLRRVAAVTALLLLCLWIWYLLWDTTTPQDGSRKRDSSSNPAAARDARSGKAQEGPREADSEQPSKHEVRFPGPTRFVRRLAAGDLLRREGRKIPPVLLNALLPAMLRVDQLDNMETEDKAQLVNYLTRPRRDHGALKRVSDGLLIRIWTPNPGRYSKSEVKSAEGSLGHVLAVTGISLPRGIDVLATPAVGAEVFPGLGRPSWAAGVYLPSDDFCALRSTLSPAARPTVLLHECVHALCYRLKQPFSQSPLITEGLAEYLSRVRPGDKGLWVPPKRFANNFARLRDFFRMLEEAGAPVDRLEPSRLVKLDRGGFYALRGFTYLLAQATMARIGGGAIMTALRRRSDEPLRRAIASMHWTDFRMFVERYAQRGNPALAMTVEDFEPVEEPTLSLALRELGIPVSRPIDPRLFRVQPTDLSASAAQIEAVRRLIRKPSKRPLVVVLDRSADVGEATRGRYVELLETLAMRKPVVVGLDNRPKLLQRYEIAQVALFGSVGFLRWLDRQGLAHADLVVCIGQDHRRKKLNKFDRSVRKSGVRPRAVLIVDYGDGIVGRQMAHGFAALYEHTGNVAYWRPE